MDPVYDTSCPRESTTVTIYSDLLRQARQLGVDILEECLVEIVTASRRERWLAENRVAIEVYNERVERDGVFSEGVRRF